MAANADQIAYWNGPGGARWVKDQDTLDRLVAVFGDAAMAKLAATPGARVLDVGCGCGATTLEIAAAVGAGGAGGAVLGVDVSAPMLAVARARAEARGLPVTFLEADAGALAAPAAPFDLLFSRFGIMFFDDPATAFGALRAQLRPDGRMAAVCWQGPKQNPWAMAPLLAVRALLPEAPPPGDPLAPGPFALADAARTKALFEAAGWRDVALAPFTAPMALGPTAAAAAASVLKIGPAAALLREFGAGREAAAEEAVAAALAPYAGPEGVAPPGAVWVVTARA